MEREVQLARAESTFLAGDFATALQQYGDALKAYPDSEEASFIRSWHGESRRGTGTI